MAEPPPALPDGWPHRGRSGFVDSGGLRWHVQRWRREGAPVALLLHGTGAGAFSWRHLAPLLAERYDVIAPDLPGHAFTATPASQPLDLPSVSRAVARLLQSLHATPSLVIGHSAGAAIALRGSLDARARVPIVSVNGAILPLQGPLGRLFLPIARLLAGAPLVAPAFAAWAALPPVAKRLLDSTGSRIDAEGERCYAQLVADHAHAAGALRLMASWDLAPLERELPALDAPLLLISAAGDRTLPPSHAARVHALLPQAQRVELPKLGHLAHEEDAAAVWRAVQDWQRVSA